MSDFLSFYQTEVSHSVCQLMEKRTYNATLILDEESRKVSEKRTSFEGCNIESKLIDCYSNRYNLLLRIENRHAF